MNETIFLGLRRVKMHTWVWGFPRHTHFFPLENYSNFDLKRHPFLLSLLTHHFIKKDKAVLFKSFIIKKKKKRKIYINCLFLFSSEEESRWMDMEVDTWWCKEGVVMHPSAHDRSLFGNLIRYSLLGICK